MTTILDTIAAATRNRVAQDEERVSLAHLKQLISVAQSNGSTLGNGKNFFDALATPELSFICEVKKASPSKGIIAEDFPYLEIAREYEAAGADCISCLTEPQWFMGSDQIFLDIRRAVGTPMIRKDFTVSEYQIYQARLMGADAILLICALMDTAQLKAYLELTHELGMVALVETHDQKEIEQALEVGARIIGVNNRNLKDFSVDFSNAERLRNLIPDDCIYVAESGVKNAEDIATIAAMGANATLVGEALMRSTNKKEKLAEFRTAANRALKDTE